MFIAEDFFRVYGNESADIGTMLKTVVRQVKDAVSWFCPVETDNSPIQLFGKTPIVSNTISPRLQLAVINNGGKLPYTSSPIK